MISLLFPLHTGSALISISLFIWRGLMMWRGRPLKSRLLRRTLPDAVDTLFLGSGIGMAVIMEISPLASDWLATKIAALILYILLGMFALKYRGNRWIKRAAFIGALAAFAYIALVANKIVQPLAL